MDIETQNKLKESWNEAMQRHLTWLDTYEPNSNARIAIEKMYKQREEEEKAAEKLRADEAAKKEKQGKKGKKAKKQD